MDTYQDTYTHFYVLVCKCLGLISSMNVICIQGMEYCPLQSRVEAVLLIFRSDANFRDILLYVERCYILIVQ